MTNRRSKIIDALVHPAVLPGLTFVSDTVTLTDSKVLTVSFSAKTVNAVLCSPVTVVSGASATVDDEGGGTGGTAAVSITTENITWASSVSGNTATVTFTCTAATSSTLKFSYLIVATPTETIAANAITANTTETPIT